MQFQVDLVPLHPQFLRLTEGSLDVNATQPFAHLQDMSASPQVLCLHQQHEQDTTWLPEFGQHPVNCVVMLGTLLGLSWLCP